MGVFLEKNCAAPTCRAHANPRLFKSMCGILIDARGVGALSNDVGVRCQGWDTGGLEQLRAGQDGEKLGFVLPALRQNHARLAVLEREYRRRRRQLQSRGSWG